MFDVMPIELIITNERVDDIPVLLTQIEQMGVQKLIPGFLTSSKKLIYMT